MKRIAAFGLLVVFLGVSFSMLVSTGKLHTVALRFFQARPANAKERTSSKLGQSTQPGRNFSSSPADAGAAAPIRNRVSTNGASSRETSTGSAHARNGSRKSRAWAPNFLASLHDAAEKDPIQFALPDGQMAFGKISRLEHANGEVVQVTGRLSEPEAGRFFFQKQTMPGVAGDFVGVVEFPDSQKAFRIEPTDTGGDSELVERPLQSVMCVDLPRPVLVATDEVQEIPPLKPGDFPTVPIPAYQKGVVVLESLAGSLAVIYLDFQGGYTPSWGGVTYERPNLSGSQIRDIWKRVAEDFMPFNINVTTDVKVFERAPKNGRQRVIITPTDTARPGAGGAAYSGSFNWTEETPCWVFQTTVPKYCAEGCAHEAGHALGLSHDGQDTDGTHAEYYYGHGTGDTSWAPTMGVGFPRNVTQWSKGEYLNANNPQDQLAIIASQNNNVHYRDDDTGDTLATSRYLDIHDDYTASAEGLIEKTGDIDAFQFTTSGGDISLRADPVNASADLALQVMLYDSNEKLLASNNPQTTLWASLTTNLVAGTYTFRVSGAGRNDPLTNGFSAYASLGYYSISGSVANARLPNRFVIPENTPTGTILGVVPANNLNHDFLTYRISSGNISNTFALDDSGRLSVADSSLLDYEALAGKTKFPVQFEMFVDIINPGNPALNETNRRVVVAITDVNEPPAFTGIQFPELSRLSLGAFATTRLWSGSLLDCLTRDCSFTASVTEHSPPGTLVGTMIASDPDSYTLLSYSIVAGNSDGMFSIDHESGAISVAGDLVAATQNAYDLVVAVSDQTPPTPLVATSTVTIQVELPYSHGSISYAVYTNINGTLVSALTNHSSFPREPAWEKQIASFEGASNLDDNYGAVMRGYLLPPLTGNYTFYVASMDNGELWLSSSTNADGMTQIASISGDGDGAAPREWTKYPSQQSAPIFLAAGYAYYIEARMKAGAGADHFAVAWECASNGIARAVIPGEYLAPFFMNYVPHPIGFVANVHTDTISTRVGSIEVADINSNDTETLTITAGNEEGLFAIDEGTGIIRFVSDSALRTASQTNYTLQVQATDNGLPPLTGATAITINLVDPNTIAAGSLQQEIWTNIGNGTAVRDLTSQAKYPKQPDVLRALSGFDSGSQGFGNNYGSRIRAYLTPTNTGAYTFFLASADESELYLGSDSDTAASMIAWVNSATEYQEWTRFSSQQSDPRWLVAGQQYYLETLHKQAGDNDHIEVGWTGPGLSGTNVVDSSFLSPPDIGYPPELSVARAAVHFTRISFTGTNGSVFTNVITRSFLSSPDIEHLSDPAVVKVSFAATNGALVTGFTAADSALDTIAYKIVSGNSGNTFAIDPDTGQLTVADNTLLAAYAVTNFSLVVMAQDSGYGGLYPLKSSQITVAVQAVDDAPPVAWIGSGIDSNWSTEGNWNRGVPDARNKLMFGGLRGRTNYNDVLLEAGLVTINTGGFYLGGNTLVLHGGLSSSGDNTWAINSTLIGKQTFINASRTFVVAGSVNNNGYDLTLVVNGTLLLDGVISGAGGVFKSGLGKTVMSARNTYTGPTVVSLGALALTNSGAISTSATVDVQDRAVLDGSGLNGSFAIPVGQTLKGSGMVIGPVTVNGTLAQGFDAARDWLTFSNRLVLAGKTVIQISASRAPQAGELVRVAGDLEYGGNLIVSNQNSQVRFGDLYKLFDAARFSGAFAEVQLPPLNRGLLWDTSQLTVDGTLQVLATPQQILIVTLTGKALVIRFQSAIDVKYLIESTTSLQPPAGWGPVATRIGSGGLITLALSRDQAEPQRFFRIRAVKAF